MIVIRHDSDKAKAPNRERSNVMLIVINTQWQGIVDYGKGSHLKRGGSWPSQELLRTPRRRERTRSLEPGATRKRTMVPGASS